MKFNYINISALTISALIFSGCASSLSTVVKKPISEITANKTDSYITFARPQTMGYALSNTVIEFDPITKETNLVGSIGSYEKIIYKTSPGTHYFYMSGGENDDMIKVSTDNSKMYYVTTDVQFGIMTGRFYFKPLKNSSLKILKELADAKCTDDLLKKYEFAEQKNKISSLKQYKSMQLNATITCLNGKISNINNLNPDLDEINECKIVEPNKKAFDEYKEDLDDYLSEIDEDFEEWEKEDLKDTEVKVIDGFKL